MASGFRRPLARHGGRTIAALAIAAIVAQAAATPAAPAAPLRVTSIPGGPATSVAVTRSDGSGATSAAFRRAASPATGAGPDLDAAAADTAGLQPSIQYEEAERHANDKIAFTPGGKVTVGFEPRPGDSWAVGGVHPTRLPAGRLDGKAIRGQGANPGRNGPAAPDAAIDAPTTNQVPVDATPASFRDATVPTVSDPGVRPEAAISQNGLRREIFGFLPYWEVNSSSLRLDYAKISTIAYFGVGADGAGNLQKRNTDGTPTVGWSGWTSSKMTSIISAAHASRTRVVLTVQSFGWSTAGLNRQKQLLGSSTNRLRLARQIAAAVRDRGADGVNLDFEPLASTYDAEFTALVRTVRAELNKIHAGYQITFDTLGSIGNYPIADATAPGGADAIFIMGYDYRTSGSSPVGSIAPLGRTGYDIRDTIAAYTARVAPSKLILGVPYYGRAWSTNSSALHATNTSGTKFGASTTVVYDTAADYLAEHGRKYDAAEGVAWTAYQRQNCTSTYGCVTSWRQLYVDDATAIGAKYDLVNRYGLRGAGIWALGYDGARPELWAVIQRKFVTDTTPPKSGIRTLPGGQANPGFAVSWTGKDDVAVASYDIQVSTDGGAWAGWLSATKATSATWFGVDGHAYAFRARARDPRGNLGAWTVTSTSPAATATLAAGGFGVVRFESINIRPTPDTSASVIGTYGKGDVVQIMAGPTTADGYTWYKVAGPIAEWSTVGTIRAAAWIPTSSGRVSPTKAPNATRVTAFLGGLGFGDAGPASVGTAAAAASHRAFSPNGDGRGDALAIDWTNARAFDSIALRVFKADGTLVGNVAVPASQLAAGARQVAWNGKVGSATLPNGRYLVSLVGTSAGTAFYNPAAAFRSASLATYGVTVDTVAPAITSASASGALLSPNGDGILDTVRVAFAAGGANSWQFTATSLTGPTAGTTVATKSGTGGSAAVTWNGQSNGGTVVADGTYRLILSALDHAANRTSRSWQVRVDRTPATIAAVATPAAFSPNGDGAADTTRLAWTASERLTGTVRIVKGTTVIRTWAVSGATSGAITWNGLTSSGAAAPDGTYMLRVSGRDVAGNFAARNTPVVVDRTLSTVRWSRAAFHPQDGDALLRTARVSFTLKRSAAVSVAIYSGATLIRTVWTNKALAAGPQGWTWDGRDATGALVPRGLYSARVTARSWVGTSAVSRWILADAFAVALSASTVRAGQTLTLTITTTEPLKAAPRVAFGQPGRAAVTKTATSLGGGKYRVSFAVASGAAGTATIRITGRDTSGGLNSSTRTVTIR